ncbi:outer membrane transport energization protein ExbB [Hoeflea marina]|uniref:Outer membrane transport energization protein ExbB n=1 Tax=Hoeflea marina TaxID=274592 RepID=A0A317PSV8_9HYPH|nr:MotA/TolQ/ExbB proton channel family protein [Hoeflea marina]PWW03845.1 outer membrane transport energization protein ExbB [Hoeflea marina]
MQSGIDQLKSILDLGGPVVAVLFLVSVLAVAVIALKLLQFVRAGVGRRKTAEAAVMAWVHGNRPEARALVAPARGALASCVALTFSLSSNGRASKSEIEEQVASLAMHKLHELRGGMAFLDTVVQLSPLLGLFGTVLGMIEAFRKLQGAGAVVDPSILAGGIWVALLTTAVGLAIAMPVSVVLTWFETRIEDERVAIETTITQVLSAGRPAQPDDAGAARAGGTSLMELRHAH